MPTQCFYKTQTNCWRLLFQRRQWRLAIHALVILQRTMFSPRTGMFETLTASCFNEDLSGHLKTAHTPHNPFLQPWRLANPARSVLDPSTLASWYSIHPCPLSTMPIKSSTTHQNTAYPSPISLYTTSYSRVHGYHFPIPTTPSKRYGHVTGLYSSWTRSRFCISYWVSRGRTRTTLSHCIVCGGTWNGKENLKKQRWIYLHLTKRQSLYLCFRALWAQGGSTQQAGYSVFGIEAQHKRYTLWSIIDFWKDIVRIWAGIYLDR